MVSAANADEAAKRRALAEAAEWFAEWQAGVVGNRASTLAGMAGC
ncbi:hypothetical protein [Halomonas sp. PA16-9]